MSTSRDIALVPIEGPRWLASRDEEQGLLENVGDVESRDTILSVSPEEQGSPEKQGVGDIEMIYEMDCKHTIFLSHSGAQKNFVEQLCEDLERAKMSAFFDRRPESLPKGEVFAPHIFQAADQCELAVVVVSEDYFTRSKWPMLELCAFVQSSKPKVILPLFFGLAFKDMGNPERRKLWFEKWQAWAEADARIRVEDWKVALRELDRRNGLHYVEVLGEVEFRKDVVRAAYAITQKILQEKALQRWSIHEQSRRAMMSSFSWTKAILWVIFIIMVGVVAYYASISLHMLIITNASRDIFKKQSDEMMALFKNFTEPHGETWPSETWPNWPSQQQGASAGRLPFNMQRI